MTIDSSAQTAGDSHTHQGSQTVFISDSNGYRFYRDSDGSCVYSKTTNKGTSWGAAVQVDSQTDCDAVVVWYDQWTPNATSGQQYIHIATMDDGNDDTWYNRLDTTSDTLLLGSAPVSAVVGSGQAGRFDIGVNFPTISKSTTGTVYIGINDATNGGGDNYIVRCSTNCNTTGGWTEAGTSPLDSYDGDTNILMPLVGGEMMIINRDFSANVIRSKIWNGTAWSAAWTTIDGAATGNGTYDVGMSATVASSTSAATTTIYLAYIADNATLGTDDDIRTAKYSGGVWSANGAVLTNDTKGLTSVALSRDTISGNLYVAYSGRTTAATASTGNVYWKSSTNAGTSWGVETGPVNTSANDIYGVDLDLMSDQRVYASWFQTTGATIAGDTIADLIPGITASGVGSQIAQATASTTGVYVGGAFALVENVSARNVTGVTITENGTIDAQNSIANVKLLYENDTVAPYDCASVSYDGTESQFGSTDTNGFSGSDGISTFTGSSVGVSPTSAMCIYVVMDVLDSASNDSTINVTINSPNTDISASGGGDIGPTTVVDITGSTTVKNDILTQTHFHWRNDDGSETTATSKTGGIQDTALGAMTVSTPTRLRLEVANLGGTTSPATQYRLEYGSATSTCQSIVSWTDVGAAADDWDMSNSPNLTDGANTTNISTAIGGVSDSNAHFITPNSAVKDTSSQTGNITATSTEFVELEYSIIASTTAVAGNTYCFRVTSAGAALPSYQQYPRATISADVSVTATSSQTTTTDVPTTGFYIGGAYVITENASSRNVTGITLTENGSVNGATGVANVKLLYDVDTTAPYDCSDQSYSGSESQFGSTDADGFSSADGTSTFSGTVAISTTRTMCVYVVLDITTLAHNGDTLNVVLNTPSSDVAVSGGGTVAPTITRDITGSTTLRGAILTQTHYHWRRDNGTETTATSFTNGTADTALTRLDRGVPARLRLEVSNSGATTSPAEQYRLEYGTKVTTCSAVSSWTNVADAGGAWDMFDSANLTNGGDTTDIAVATGGVANSNATFLTPNGAIRDTTSQTGNLTLSTTQFAEMEYAIAQTANAGYSVSYCFRVTEAGASLDAYSVYAELTTAPKRDFKVQRGTATILTGTTVTIAAGVDYDQPAASTSAFIRITNVNYTGAGPNTGGGNPGASSMTAYIQNPSNLMTSVTFARTGATRNTRISWEIVEYVGDPGGDNEMKVRAQDAVTYGTTATFATGTAVSGIVDNNDVAVFLTGQFDPDAGVTNFNSGESVTSWASGTSQPVFERGDAGGDASIASYAVVEFTGQNWAVQRASHTYAAAGSVETEDITAVNSLAHTFTQAQKLTGTGLTSGANYGAEVWLSSVGQLSLKLDSNATSPASNRSVVWVIENTESTNGAMTVTRSNGTTNAGTAPLTVSVSIGATLSDLSNSSLMVTAATADTGTNFPRALAGATLASTTAYELWRADTGAAMNYRTAVIEWPVAGLSFRQNYYRIYADNNATIPTDPWPVGGSDLGENTSITASDQPPGDGENMRIRMSLAIGNATFPTTTQAFKLQYGQRVTSCSAISSVNWHDLGDSASSTIWRGYAATGTTDGSNLSANPPTAGQLKLSVSDVGGTLEEENTSGINPYSAEPGQDVEYDWNVQDNGATADTFYCFRMIASGGTSLDGYSNYPQIRTGSFTPRTQNWRWYGDENNETPTAALASENTTPIDIANSDPMKLRVTVKETKNITKIGARFKLQYSEYSNFSTSTFDVASTSACTASSTWCYYDGGGSDNGVITTKVLSDSNSCASGVGTGCGTHNESPNYSASFTHVSGAATEYEFTLKSAGPRVNDTYYFRLYDLSQNVPVVFNTGYSYPSVTTEGAHLTYTASALATSTATEGVTTDTASTPTGISFGHMIPNTPHIAAQRLTVTTNATQGYQTLMASDGGFIASNGETIPAVSASNTAPAAWSVVCTSAMWGCYGYHAGDDTLANNSTRFAPNDTFAALEVTPREVAYSSIPVTNDVVDVVFKIETHQAQPPGSYETDVTFITAPVF